MLHSQCVYKTIRRHSHGQSDGYGYGSGSNNKGMLHSLCLLYSSMEKKGKNQSDAIAVGLVVVGRNNRGRKEGMLHSQNSVCFSHNSINGGVEA